MQVESEPLENCWRMQKDRTLDPALTDRIMAQGKALVRAIEALVTIQPSGPFERALACLLMVIYKHALDARGG